MRRITMAVAVVVAAFLLVSCSGADDALPRGSSTTEGAGSGGSGSGSPIELIAALEPYDSCDVLFEEVTSQALERVGPYGIESPVMFESLPTTGVEDAEAGTAAEDDASTRADVPPAAPGEGAADQTADQTADEAADPTYSDTNVQEEGVDEPDLVKTDGSRVLVVTNGVLHVLEAGETGPQLVGELALTEVQPTEMFLRGDRALLLGTAYDIPVGDGQSQDEGVALPTSGSTAIVEVDLADPAAPRVVATQYVEGTYLSARAVDGTARIVVASTPQPALPEPAAGPLGDDEDDVEEWEEAATRANRQAIERSTVEDWIPQVVSVGSDGSTATSPLTPCEQVSHPTEFSGFGVLSVLTADLDQPLGDLQAVSVQADGETVYAGTESLYVATNRWDVSGDDGVSDELPPEEAYTTEIHRFGIAGEGPAAYEASGSVRGHLLNQFSLSEHEGHLRVATTDGSPWGAVSPSESFVTVLAPEGDELRQVGQVGDLGLGEEIFAVRFLGDVGYVVTFEQTDPLYTIDLADPANPRVVGELEIPGYSAYLHPAGEGLLIGVGQDGTDEGALLGTQVSLFDVSNLAEPQRIQQASVGGSSSSAVEYDHRAFLWWPATSTAVIPVEDYESGFSGVVVYRITPDGITELGRVDHTALVTGTQQPGQGQEPGQDPGQGIEPGAPPPTNPTCPPDADCVEPLPSPVPLPTGQPILRSLIIGDQLWTVSAAGVQVNDLATLADIGSATF